MDEWLFSIFNKLSFKLLLSPGSTLLKIDRGVFISILYLTPIITLGIGLWLIARWRSTSLALTRLEVEFEKVEANLQYLSRQQQRRLSMKGQDARRGDKAALSED